MQSDSSGSSTKGRVTDSGWSVFGWDKGYVAFDEVATTAKNGSETTVFETQYSTDGLSWFAGQSFTPPSPDRKIGAMGVLNVLQGPGGLLLYRDFDCVCVCVVPTIVPLAVTTDGADWQTVKGNIVGDWLTVGPSGYAATEGTQVETSQDGVDWTKTRLNSTPSAKVDRVDSVGAFAGGFVVTSERYGGTTPPGTMCGQPWYRDPAMWFSSTDGSAWTQESIPGGTTGKGASVRVCNINGLLLAETWDGSATGLQVDWTSTDGMTWSEASPDVTCDDTQAYGRLLPLEGRNLYLDYSVEGNGLIEVLGPDLHLTFLPQTGSSPGTDVWANDLGAVALGPAGLIVSDGQGNLWIGVPTAG